MMLDDVHDVLDAAGERWREAFTPLVKGVVVGAADHWQVQAGLSFDVRNLEAEAWFDQYMLVFADPIQKTSADEIAELLQQGTREGWSIPQMQDTLTQLFEQWVSGTTNAADFAGARLPPYRSEAIARTETIRAYGAGSTQIYQANGIQEHQWLATLDNRTRDSHAEANGQVQPMDTPFDIGGSQMAYPGDASLGAPPEEFVNCRCTVLPVIDGDTSLEGQPDNRSEEIPA
jgi:SPP1 gp7 family putative phage head morphogenesis protein